MILQNSQGMSAVAQRKLSEWQTSYDYNDHAWLLGRSQKAGSTTHVRVHYQGAHPPISKEQGSKDLNQTDPESYSHPKSHPIP